MSKKQMLAEGFVEKHVFQRAGDKPYADSGPATSGEL